MENVSLTKGDRVKKTVKIAILLFVLLCLTAVAISLADNLIQTDQGDLNIAPQGELHMNTTKIQMRSPDGSWSCCGPDNNNVWSCTGGEC